MIVAARWACVALACAAVFAVHAAAPPARGLIVKLKDAPPHEQALALHGAVHPDAQRWQRVLGETGIAPRRMKPSGRAAQLLDFERVLSGDEAEAMAARLRGRPDVEWVVPNERERRLQQAPNDLGFSPPQNGSSAEAQWWLYAPTGSDGNVLAERLRGVPGLLPAWSIEQGKASARVAVLDTGITAHPELAGHVLPGYDFVSVVEYSNDGDGRDADPTDPGDFVSPEDAQTPAFAGCVVEDSSWHGTIIAGQIAALTNNTDGVAAINWNGRILPVRVAGKCGADVADIIDGMRWAAGLPVPGVPTNPLANRARIINISFGGSAPCNAAYQAAIDELAANNVIVVAAAGNEHTAPTRPANCTGVVGVAALNRDGFKSSYSNFGPSLAIATVGGDPGNDPARDGRWASFLGDSGLLTLINDGLRGPGDSTYAFLSGTSFAAPLVSGVASLMLSVNPQLTAAQLIDGLRLSARPHVTSSSIGACSEANPGRCLCTTTTCGAGILDAVRALQFAQGGPPGALSPAQINNNDVRAAASTGPDRDPNPVAGNGGGGGGTDTGGGGGALGFGWLAGLALAVLLLAQARRRS